VTPRFFVRLARPGIKVDTSPTDQVSIDQMQFTRFSGKSWERFGELQTGN